MLALCCWLGATPRPAAAAERILNFVSDVSVQRDGDLQVTETIVVNAEGDKIRRGILRDFPTIYSASNGRRVEVAFDVAGGHARRQDRDLHHREALRTGCGCGSDAPTCW